MDKKNTILGILCLLAGVGLMVKQTADMRSQQLEQEGTAEQMLDSSQEKQAASASESEAFEAASLDEVSESVLGLLAEPVESIETVYPEVDEKIITLANEFVEVEFTTTGGAIKSVSFLQTKKGSRDTYVFNENGFLPALSLSLAGKESDLQAFNFPYKIEDQSTHSITFAFDFGKV